MEVLQDSVGLCLLLWSEQHRKDGHSVLALGNWTFSPVHFSSC